MLILMMTFICVLLTLLRNHLRSTICIMLTFSINLNNILFCLASVGFCLSGDLNSRIGSKTDFIQYDRSIGEDDVSTIELIIPRLAFLKTTHPIVLAIACSLCKATNLRIVNGRWSGDRGNFTCLTHKVINHQ